MGGIADIVNGYRKNGTIPPFPQTVHIDIINSCNLKCPQCWNHSPLLKEKKTPEWKRLKLPYGNFKLIIDDLKKTGVRKLILSGGGDDRFCQKEKVLRDHAFQWPPDR
jgi:MoaA/NifB/PqqE/SkfB family radical SAM enzyme